MKVELTVIEGPHQGKTFTFEDHDTFVVGRGSRAHFRLPRKDPYFSRLHFLVEVNPPLCRLMDLDSTNGTFVNNTRVQTVDLGHGDEIRGGDTAIKVTIDKVDGNVNPNSAATVMSHSPAAGQETVSYTPEDHDKIESAARRAARLSATGTDLCAACSGSINGDGSGLMKGRFENIADPDFWKSTVCPDCLVSADEMEQLIDGYLLIKEIGRGGMGIVSLAVHHDDANLVAVKAVSPTAEMSSNDVERFLREARILCELNHPSIVGFREMGESQGNLFFAMEYVNGPDASKLMRQQKRPLKIPMAVAIVSKVLGALSHSHEKGFVHRDIKPSNMLLAKDNDKLLVKLADFGLARVYQSSKMSGLTMQGSVGGTAGFMAPEQITEFRDARPPVDLYACGASLYNLLTGKFVFNLSKRMDQALLMVLQDDPIPIRDRREEIPIGLAEVIHQSLEKDPKNRFPDAQTMQKAISPFLK